MLREQVLPQSRSSAGFLFQVNNKQVVNYLKIALVCIEDNGFFLGKKKLFIKMDLKKKKKALVQIITFITR